jgi:glutaredoxin
MVNVTVLTQPSCVYCDHAKEILSRLAPDYSLDISEVGLQTEEGRKLAVTNGVMFAPGILIDGKLFSFGRLSEKKLKFKLDRERAE